MEEVKTPEHRQAFIYLIIIKFQESFFMNLWISIPRYSFYLKRSLFQSYECGESYPSLSDIHISQHISSHLSAKELHPRFYHTLSSNIQKSEGPSSVISILPSDVLSSECTIMLAARNRFIRNPWKVLSCVLSYAL